MKNKLIASIFREIASVLELKGENVFRIRAYERAAGVIENLAEDAETAYRQGRITGLPGIGKDLSAKIGEIVETGALAYHKELLDSVPRGVLELLSIPSVGPKTARLLSEELKITGISDLQKAIEQGRLKGLPGVKDKTIENISRGIALVLKGAQRMSLAQAEAVASVFTEPLSRIPGVKKVVCAGSLRRRKESVRDIDILVVAKDPLPVMDAFTAIGSVSRVQSKGDTKSSVLTDEGVQVDCRVVDQRLFGAAAVYFTGSRDFNVRLRQLAQRMGHKISEYGVFAVSGQRDDKFVCGRTEEELFDFLRMQYVPPELRENSGEIEASLAGKLPKLVDEKDIKGDLHAHSNWSDGADTIEQMALAAKARGYSYIAITDHSQSLKVARGLSVTDVAKKREEISSLNLKLKPFRILFGAEVDIDSDGNLDYPDSVLNEFDIVVAAIHTGMQQSGEKITRRIVKACSHPKVNIIAHPTGRLRGVRDEYDIDMNVIFREAARTNTALEINSFPDRMDLNDINCRRAKEEGVRISINTDSHSTDHLDFIRYGLAMARRGWLTRDNVLNAMSVSELLSSLKK